MSQDKTDKHPQQLVQEYLDALLFDPDEVPADPPGPDSDVTDNVPASADENDNDAFSVSADPRGIL